MKEMFALMLTLFSFSYNEMLIIVMMSIDVQNVSKSGFMPFLMALVQRECKQPQQVFWS